MIIYTKKFGYLAIRNYLANILFGFVSNEVGLQHLKTQQWSVCEELFAFELYQIIVNILFYVIALINGIRGNFVTGKDESNEYSEKSWALFDKSFW